MNQRYLQMQKQYTQKEQIQQQEIKQYVQQDLLNILGIVQDVQETLNFYQHDMNNELVKVQFNRLILQCNISNMLHTDLKFNSQNQIDFLNQEKQKVNYLLQTQINKFNPQIQYYLYQYQKNSLCNNPIQKQEQQFQVNVQAQFNQQVVSKVIGGLQTQDQISNQIKQGKIIKDINQDYIDDYLKDRSSDAKRKLRKNIEGDSYDCDICKIF